MRKLHRGNSGVFAWRDKLGRAADKSNKLHDIELFVVRDEPEHKAALFQSDAGKKVWLARSLIEYELFGRQNAHAAKVTPPEWLAFEKGLI